MVIFSYNYFGQTAKQIQELAIEDLQTNTEIEVDSISNSLSNATSTVTFNLEIIGNSPAVIEGNNPRIHTLLTVARDTRRNLTIISSYC